MTKSDFIPLARLLEQRIGLALGSEKDYLFTTRLSALMVEFNLTDPSLLIEAVERDIEGNLTNRVIDAMTTHETTWFRDPPLWVSLETRIIPELHATARREQRSLACWSCACSTGQEPYSLAMIVHELYSNPGPAPVLATDVSPAAIAITRRARYSRLSMSRGRLETRFMRHFTQENNVFTLHDEIKGLVQPDVHNLKDPLSRRPESFDLILCRNVLVYFTQVFRRRVIDRLIDALRPGGVLVLGGTEGLYGEFDQLQLMDEPSFNLYRKFQVRQ